MSKRRQIVERALREHDGAPVDEHKLNDYEHDLDRRLEQPLVDRLLTNVFVWGIFGLLIVGIFALWVVIIRWALS